MDAKLYRMFAKNERGSVMIYTAFAMVALFGMAGLAIDVGYWYMSQRNMQSAADATAMAAALEMARGATSTEIETRAKASAALNGYPASDVTINRPPLSGPNVGNANFVEAIVLQATGGFLSDILHPDDADVAARAVATVAPAPSCVVALDPVANAALSVRGNADVDLDCGAYSNSADAVAVQEAGNACLTATAIQAVGGYSGNCLNPTPKTGMPAAENPFAYLTPPGTSPWPCDEPNTVTLPSSYGGPPLAPGVYCGGIVISGADVDFLPGLYILEGVGLQISGNGTVTGDDVTFYFAPTVVGAPSEDYPSSSAPGNRAVYIAGQAAVDLKASLTGDYQGILFYGDPAMDPSMLAELAGGSNMSLEGTIYFPSHEIYYAGGSVSTTATWTAIIGRTVNFVGTSYVASGGFVGGNLPLALTSPSLAE